MGEPDNQATTVATIAKHATALATPGTQNTSVDSDMLRDLVIANPEAASLAIEKFREQSRQVNQDKTQGSGNVNERAIAFIQVAEDEAAARRQLATPAATKIRPDFATYITSFIIAQRANMAAVRRASQRNITVDRDSEEQGIRTEEQGIYELVIANPDAAKGAIERLQTPVYYVPPSGKEERVAYIPYDEPKKAAQTIREALKGIEKTLQSSLSNPQHAQESALASPPASERGTIIVQNIKR